MLKEEFERLICSDIPNEVYKEIEYVFNYHPSQMDKSDAAMLYNSFGLRIFRDMKDAADVIFDLEDQIHDLENDKHDIDIKIASIKKDIEIEHKIWRDSKNGQ